MKLETLCEQSDAKKKLENVKFQNMPKGDNRILLIRENNSNVFLTI